MGLFGGTKIYNMKKYLISLAIAAAIALMFYAPKFYNDRELTHTIDSLNVEIDHLADSIEDKEKYIELYADRVIAAEQKLAENDGKIKTIYKEYEVQVQTVDSYDVNQLEQYFSDRYKNDTK